MSRILRSGWGTTAAHVGPFHEKKLSSRAMRFMHVRIFNEIVQPSGETVRPGDINASRLPRRLSVFTSLRVRACASGVFQRMHKRPERD